MTRLTWPEKDPRERLVATFDFSDELDEGESITIAVVTCSLLSGVDASPSSVLDGSHAIDGQEVRQFFHLGVDGASYCMDCVTTLNSGRIIVRAATLPVRKA